MQRAAKLNDGGLQAKTVVQRAVRVGVDRYSMQDDTLDELVGQVATLTRVTDRRRVDQLLTRYDFANRGFENLAALVRVVNREIPDVAFDEELGTPPLAAGDGPLDAVLGQLEADDVPNMTSLVRATNKSLMELNGQQTRAVPKLLSHFWSGGALSREAMANLGAWSEKARAGRWTQYILTDRAINRALDKSGEGRLENQLGVLRELGAVIVYLDQLPIDKTEAYAALKSQIVQTGKPSGLSFMSDLVRYAQLQATGGAYVDVDVGPGSVDLRRTLEVTGNVPQVGPMFRTTREAREEGALDERGRLKESAMLDKFARPNMGIGTHLIVTPPSNPVIGMANELASADLLLAGATNGPAQILRAYQRLRMPLPDSVAASVPQWLPELEWLTPESDALVD